MIKIYRKRKNEFLRKISATIHENLVYEHPFLWRRNFKGIIDIHIDAFVVYFIYTLSLLLLINVTTYYYSSSTILFFSIMPIFPLILSHVGSPKLPMWGYFEIKEEFIVVIYVILSNIHILIYPFILFSILPDYSKPAYINETKKEIIEYTNLLTQKIPLDSLSTIQLNELIQKELNLNDEEKSIILGSLKENKINIYPDEKIDSLIDIQINRLNNVVTNNISYENYISVDYMIRFFNKKTDLKRKEESEMRTIHIFIIKLVYFVMCFFSYLEDECTGFLMNYYITPFWRKVINMSTVPFVIIIIPFIVSSTSSFFNLKFSVKAKSFSDIYYNDYVFPFFEIISYPFSSFINLLIGVAFPIFIFILFALVFLKKHLINLSLKPE